MAAEFNKHEEPDDSIFPVKIEDNSELDMYGVWIKKKPENSGEITQEKNDSEDIIFDDNKIEFDEHDVIDLNKLEEENISFEEQAIFDENIRPDSDKIIDLEETTGLASMAGIEEFDLSDSSQTEIIDEEIADDNDEQLNNLPEFQTITAEDNITVIENKEQEADMDINDFETLDLDDFLNEETAAEKEVEKEKTEVEDISSGLDENPVSDIVFDSDEDIKIITDTDDSETKALNKQDTDLNFSIEETSEFDDILNELGAGPEPQADTEKEKDGIDINITIDEDSDISSIAGKTSGANEDFDDVAIFAETPKREEVIPAKLEETPDEDLIIESTVIEAENINEIREENKRILNETESESSAPASVTEEDNKALDSMLDDIMAEPVSETALQAEPVPENEPSEDIFFDDIEAVKNDLFDEPQKQTAQSNTVLQNDRATEILLQIAGELSSIKTELATLKTELASAKADMDKAVSNKRSASETGKQNAEGNPESKDSNGFFSDDDVDETIALTGDELNNILITADFTEENAKDEFEVPEVIDMPIEEDTDETNDVFEDVKISDTESMEPILNEFENGHINSISEDLSYLEQDDIPEAGKIDDNAENYIDMPDFTGEQIEEPDLENFDLTIKELELPDGESVHFEQSADISETQNEEPFSEDANLSSFDLTPEEAEETVDDDFKIPEELVIDNQTSTEETFSPEELSEAAEDIPRLDLTTNTEEEIKTEIKTGDGAESLQPNPADGKTLPIHLKEEIKSVLTYMDQLLESLPENKIEEFAKSEYFDTYKRLFEELGIS
ncbi:hypothetical protein [Treponema pedis]|uniref:hypothetical protein n=2 Tax=Treponema pedis TaxID=409322 RepID=UPI003D217819